MAGKLPLGNSDELNTISEINVTPFVDVVLVLLVIFMVTAPMLVREQMAVNLPKAQTGEKSSSQAITITINKDGSVSIMDKSVAVDQIEGTIKTMVASNPNAQAIISADQDSKHGDVVRVMDIIKKAGLTKFAIQIEHK